MRFKQWIINERIEGILSEPVDGIEMIDMRFEDYPTSDIHGIFKPALMNTLHTPSFYGIFPNGSYLHYDGRKFSVIPHLTKDIKRNSLRLPDDWYSYAAGYDQFNQTIKHPMKLRSHEMPLINAIPAMA